MTADLYAPTATYRLQFHAGFTFTDAAAQVGYLRDLGSAIFTPRPFSRRGRDRPMAMTSSTMARSIPNWAASAASPSYPRRWPAPAWG